MNILYIYSYTCANIEVYIRIDSIKEGYSLSSEMSLLRFIMAITRLGRFITPLGTEVVSLSSCHEIER